MATATIDLGLNASPFEQGLARAQTATATFSSKVEGLFKRDIAKRAEIGISEFAANLAGGNVAGAITGLATRISGLGLAAGVGIGVAATVFTRFKGQIEDTAKATAKLEEQLARPFAFRAALSPAGISQGIETERAFLADQEEKRKTFGSRIQEAIEGAPEIKHKSIFDIFGTAQTAPLSKAGAVAKATAEDILKSEIALGDAELKRARIKEQSLIGSKAEAETLKEQLDYEERISAIKLRAGLKEGETPTFAVAKRLQAVDIEHGALLTKTAQDKERAAFAEALKSPEQRAAEAQSEENFRRFQRGERRNPDLINKEYDAFGELIGGTEATTGRHKIIGFRERGEDDDYPDILPEPAKSATYMGRRATEPINRPPQERAASDYATAEFRSALNDVMAKYWGGG